MDTEKTSLQVDLINIFSEMSQLTLYIKEAKFRNDKILALTIQDLDIYLVKELMKTITYVSINSQIYSFKVHSITPEENTDKITIILEDLT